MPTLAYLYKWTHIPSQKWYVGSRTRDGCHPDDGYVCSSKIVKPMILEHRDEWCREILVIGNPTYIRELERDYLVAIDAQNDTSSFNRNNATGIMSFAKGSMNPMHDPIVKQKVIDQHSGENHWARKLNGKQHPQVGQKRPSITGDKHPNKRLEVAAKISEAHKGRKHPYQIGDANPMRDPVTVAKLSGENHWVRKEENKRSCPHCGIENISKSNFTRWHGENCKHKGDI
jgi:hypothetical protein